MAGRFTPVPDPSLTDMASWQYGMLAALKENVDLLTGFRSERDASSQAVLKSSVQVQPNTIQPLQRVSAVGTSVPVNNVGVPTSQDYRILLGDVQQMADDISRINETLNLLINQLRS